MLSSTKSTQKGKSTNNTSALTILWEGILWLTSDMQLFGQTTEQKAQGKAERKHLLLKKREASSESKDDTKFIEVDDDIDFLSGSIQLPETPEESDAEKKSAEESRFHVRIDNMERPLSYGLSAQTQQTSTHAISPNIKRNLEKTSQWKSNWCQSITFWSSRLCGKQRHYDNLSHRQPIRPFY